MRALIAALCVTPLALTLLGCGGGGGGDVECANKEMRLVSQSFKLDGTIEVQMPHPGSTMVIKMPVPMSVEEKIDMESMTMYAHMTYSVSMPDPMTPGNPIKEMNSDIKMSFNGKTKEGAFAMTGVMPGMPEQLKNCSYVELAWLPDAATLSKCVKDGFEKDGFTPPSVPGMGVVGPTCVKDGDLDVWSISLKNDTVAGGIEIKESWKMDKDSLMSGVSIDVKAGAAITVSGELTAKNPPTAVGPSDDDLDFNKWGFDECKQIPIPIPGPPPMQLDALSKVNQVRPGAMSVIPLLMKAQEAKEGRRLQGGMPPGMPGLPAWAKCFMPQMPPPPGVVTV